MKSGPSGSNVYFSRWDRAPRCTPSCNLTNVIDGRMLFGGRDVDQSLDQALRSDATEDEDTSEEAKALSSSSSSSSSAVLTSASSAQVLFCAYNVTGPVVHSLSSHSPCI
mmetsp:Transcript_16288/g.22900  ORF Transcript_16288/g.22900 Transcript_16288/m.22900 type:complete len:110 (+) Transcript_16288:170-499(+)